MKMEVIFFNKIKCYELNTIFPLNSNIRLVVILQLNFLENISENVCTRYKRAYINMHSNQ